MKCPTARWALQGGEGKAGNQWKKAGDPWPYSYQPDISKHTNLQSCELPNTHPPNSELSFDADSDKYRQNTLILVNYFES